MSADSGETADQSIQPNDSSQSTAWKRARKVAKRLFLGIGLLVGLYVAIILIGLIPVNNDFRQDEDGIEIGVFAGSFHAEFILPVENEIMNWKPWLDATRTEQPVDDATYVAIGWGEHEFFINTPTWEEFRISTGIKALFLPSKSCMHVTFHDRINMNAETKSIKISEEQYRVLTEFVLDGFEKSKEDTFIQIEGASYGDHDAFFVSNGNYHLLNTCNSWVGRGLRKAGVRTAWYTPLPRTFQWYLPE